MAKHELDIKVELPPEAKARLNRIQQLIERNSELSLNEYQRRSMRTSTLVFNEADWAFQLSGYGLGIAGEAGEVADYLKKVLHHGHELDRERLKKELGDVLWYAAAIADRADLTLEEVAQANIDKLMERYPEGFTSERSINRAQDDQ